MKHVTKMNEGFAAKATEAEIGVLCCMRQSLLLSVAECERCGITEAHFTLPNRDLYVALRQMWLAGKPFDYITLVQVLRAAGNATWTDRETLRAALYEPVPVSLLPGYIETLINCHVARALYGLGQRLTAAALNPAEDTSALVLEARIVIDGIGRTEVAETRLGEYAKLALRQIYGDAEDAGDTIELGLGLDEDAGPFCRGDLVVIAGATKSGKSALATSIVVHVAGGWPAPSGGRCAIFSLEMTGTQTAERMLAARTSVDVRSVKLRRAGLGDTHLSLSKCAQEFDGWHVDIFEDTYSLNLICANMVRLHSAGGIDLAVVDYAQLVHGIREKGDNREREVASISRLLKRAAVQCRCVVLLLSQLNEAGALRESRAIGQDANCVLFLDVVETSGVVRGRAVRVGAARSAPSGTEIAVHWEPQFTRFSKPIPKADPRLI